MHGKQGRSLSSVPLERSFGLTGSPSFTPELSKLCLVTHPHQTLIAAPTVINATYITSVTNRCTSQFRYSHHIQNRPFTETQSGCINVTALRASGKFSNGKCCLNRYGLVHMYCTRLSLQKKRGRVMPVTSLLQRIDS